MPTPAHAMPPAHSRYKILRESDMPVETRNTALGILMRCVNEGTESSAIATRITKELDDALGPHWSCVTGDAYSFSVQEDFQTFLNVNHSNIFYTIWCNRTVHGPPTASGTDDKAATAPQIPVSKPSSPGSEPKCFVVSTTMPVDMAEKVSSHVAAVLSTRPESLADATEAISFRMENLASFNAEGSWDVIIGLAPAFIHPNARPGSSIILTWGALSITICHRNDPAVSSGRLDLLQSSSVRASPSVKLSSVPGSWSDDTVLASDPGSELSMPSKASAVSGAMAGASLSTRLDPHVTARSILRTVSSTSVAMLALLMMLI